MYWIPEGILAHPGISCQTSGSGCAWGPSRTWRGGNRSEGKSRRGAARPWRTSVGSCGQAEFVSWNSFQVLGVHRLWSCLPALLIIPHPLLPSWLLVGSECLVWDGRFLTSKSWSGCSRFNEQHAALVTGQGGGLSNPDRILSGAPCPHMFHFQPHIAIGSVLLFSLLFWPLTHSCRNNWGEEDRSWRKLCCPHLTRTTASKY